MGDSTCTHQYPADASHWPKAIGSQGQESHVRQNIEVSSWAQSKPEKGREGMRELEMACGQKSAQVISSTVTTTQLPTVADVH